MATMNSTKAALDAQRAMVAQRAHVGIVKVPTENRAAFIAAMCRAGKRYSVLRDRACHRNGRAWQVFGIGCDRVDDLLAAMRRWNREPDAAPRPLAKR
jgi:hypothetical protein